MQLLSHQDKSMNEISALNVLNLDQSSICFHDQFSKQINQIWTQIQSYVGFHCKDQMKTYCLLERTTVNRFIKETSEKLNNCLNNNTKYQLLDGIIKKKTEAQRKILKQDRMLVKLKLKDNLQDYKIGLQKVEGEFVEFVKLEKELLNYLLTENEQRLFNMEWVNSNQDPCFICLEPNSYFQFPVSSKINNLYLKGQNINFPSNFPLIISKLQGLKLEVDFKSFNQIINCLSLLVNLKHLSLTILLQQQEIFYISKFLLKTPNLQHLQLTDTNGHYCNIEISKQILSKLKTFKLSISNCQSLISLDQKLFFQLQQFKNLNKLILSLNLNKNVKYNDSETLLDFLKKQNTLKSLYLNLSDTQVQSKFFFKLLHSLKNKKLLSLSLNICNTKIDYYSLENAIFVFSQYMFLEKLQFFLKSLLNQEEEKRLIFYWNQKFIYKVNYMMHI